MTKRAPVIRIDLQSPVPQYRQIADALRTHLVDGNLTPGDTLPSVRRLAMELGITFNTVAQAYRQLAGEGWLDLRHGRRVVVVDRQEPARASREAVVAFRQRLREMVARMRAEGLSAGEIAAELRAAIERMTS
ncbi:MAG TPA: GntR family transcriptional regulator [Bryobacteraceae bacterium]|nr:GntR family transcriptional regulator [Bryobacteraceae bacterium]